MKLLPEKYGQAEVMTVTDGPDVSAAECGHWYSPAAVARFVAEEREAGAEFRALVKAILDNRSHCFVPNDRKGLLAWDERAEKALADAYLRGKARLKAVGSPLE